MRGYFPGVRAIDYYIEGQVVVGLSQAFYGSDVEKVGYPFFKGWGYICVLVVIDDPTGDNTRGLDDLERSITPLSAGSKVWNRAGEYSTMGTFLHPDPSTLSSLSVKYCSVSAHSFSREGSDAALVREVRNMWKQGITRHSLEFLMLQYSCGHLIESGRNTLRNVIMELEPWTRVSDSWRDDQFVSNKLT